MESRPKRSRFVSSVSAKRETTDKTAETAKTTKNHLHTKKQKNKKKLIYNQIQSPSNSPIISPSPEGWSGDNLIPL